MSSFTLKIIAIVSMFIDHLKDGILKEYSVLNVIGRIAFPLFAFQAAIGYEKTKNVYKYMQRMLIFAIISEIPFYLFSKNFTGGTLKVDVIFTLLFGIFAMYIWDYKLKNKEEKENNSSKIELVLDSIFTWTIKIMLLIVLFFIADIGKFDYGGLGVLFVLIIHLFFKDGRKIIFAILYLAYCIYEFKEPFIIYHNMKAIPYIVFMYVPIILMLLYNGKKGPSMKYFFYFFYPIHLTAILLVSYLIGA